MALTSELIEVFSRSFGRPVNKTLTELSQEERLLLGKLLFEETREYIEKGLGLMFCINDGVDLFDLEHAGTLEIEVDPRREVDPIECFDGLCDVNVVIHFNAHWQGLPLDRGTEIVNESNMSKLDDNGEPIINGVTRGYRTAQAVGDETTAWRKDFLGEPGFDLSKPIGKILKGPNFWEPKEKLAALIGVKP